MRFTGHKTILAFDGGCRGSALGALSVSQFRQGQDLTTLKALLAEFVAFMLIDEPSATSVAAPVRANRERPAERSDRTNSTTWRRNSGAYGG